MPPINKNEAMEANIWNKTIPKTTGNIEADVQYVNIQSDQTIDMKV